MDQGIGAALCFIDMLKHDQVVMEGEDTLLQPTNVFMRLHFHTLLLCAVYMREKTSRR